MPEVIVCDAGKEFAADFARQAAIHGVLTYKIGTKAPWQNGKTLREKAPEEVVLGDEEELKLLMQEVRLGEWLKKQS